MAINTGAIYGETGTYKTWNLGLLAQHIFAKTKKPVRWVTADGGGYRPIQPFIDAGIIEVLSIVNDPMRIGTLSKIVEGWWPKEIDNGMRVGKVFYTPDSVSKIGGYIFEGITSIAESIQNIYAGVQTGMKPAYAENIQTNFIDENNKLLQSGKIGGFSMDSFGLVQGHMIRSINYSWTLPVEYVWWSGHDVVVEDEEGGNKKVITGIGVVGQAATPKLGKNLGAMIHAYRVEVVDKDGVRKMETRYYYQPHLHNRIKNVMWEAKPRVPGNLMSALLDKYKGGYFVPEFNKGLDEYVRTEEGLLESSTNDLLEWKKKILEGK